MLQDARLETPAAAAAIANENIPSKESQWAAVRTQLLAVYGEDTCSSWFGTLRLEDVEGPTVHLSVATKFLGSWIRQHYADKILEIWKAQRPETLRVEYVVRGPMRAKPQRELKDPGFKTSPPETPVVVTPPPQQVFNISGPLPVQLDPRFTLDSFCEGPSNWVPAAAAKAFSKAPIETRLTTNPLFVYAGVGRGKTHLLQATAQATHYAYPDQKVIYLPADRLVAQYVVALKSSTSIAYKEHLLSFDLLIIDDLQFLRGRVQEDFGQLLGTILNGTKRVIVAADRPPAELESLDERIRSILKGGVAFEIGAPDIALRRQILETRYAAAKKQHPFLNFSPPVLEYIAQNIVNSGRELEGALKRVITTAIITLEETTLLGVETLLRDLVGARETRRVRIEDIQRVVAQHYNVSKADLLSARRTRNIVRPRQIAMYLAKTLTLRSLPEIGRRFGGRDHTTVLHAVRKIEALVASDKVFAEEIELLKRMITD